MPRPPRAPTARGYGPPESGARQERDRGCTRGRGGDSCSQRLLPVACQNSCRTLNRGFHPRHSCSFAPSIYSWSGYFGWLVLLGRSCDDAMIGSVWPSCTHRTTSSNRCRTYGRCSSGPDAWWSVGPATAADRRHVRLVERALEPWSFGIYPGRRSSPHWSAASIPRTRWLCLSIHPPEGATGARNGSQRMQTPPDWPRRLQGVIAGERLPGRLPRIRPDRPFVTGGQGVAGSNPAVPTIFRTLIRCVQQRYSSRTESVSYRVGADNAVTSCDL